MNTRSFAVSKRNLAALSLGAALGAAPARALDLQVAYPPGGGEARILIRHAPALEPLGALRLRLRFSESSGVGAATALTAFSAAAGPWSQIRPELRRDGRVIEIAVLAPTQGDSRKAEAVTVAELAVPVPAGGLSAAGDLVDSAWVVEALQPFGGPAAVALRVSTAAGKVSARRPAPIERIAGTQRILSFALAKAGRVRVRVLDAGGRTAVTVFDGRKGRGMHDIVWDGAGPGGAPLPGGTYFLRLEAGTFAYDRKLEVAR